MFVWELVSCRLRESGWIVWHTSCQDACGPIFRVQIERRGVVCMASGPTLTEAYAAASRRAHEHEGTLANADEGRVHFAWRQRAAILVGV